MIQSDALSRRSDFIPDEDHDNEDVTMLSDKLFVNLIDMELQDKIANSEVLDTDAVEAIKLLLEGAPTNLRHDLEDWKTEPFKGKNVLFFRGKKYIPKDQICKKKSFRNIMIRQQLAIPGNSRPSTRSRNTTGGQECACLPKSISKDAVFVNNSRLIEAPLIPPTHLLKDQNPHGLLAAAQWI